MQKVARVLAAAGVAAVSITCADQSTSPRNSGLARLPISPVFMVAAEGGPRIEIAKIRGILARPGSADSAYVEALVRGDSAILDFPRVIVTGDSTTYELGVKAFDASGVPVFHGVQELKVVPGDNRAAAPLLEYIAPDANVAAIEARAASGLAGEIELDWAGAEPGNVSCLNRSPSPTAQTQAQLAVDGITSENAAVSHVRVGWTSRDTSVVTVDANGLVKARCSNRSTYVVARTYLDVSDSVRVDVSAPPFTLLMDPETAAVPREDSVQLHAVVVDENGNALATTGVNWHTSDSSRATVSPTGMVHGISNGRVVITASSGDRTTVAIIEVVPPLAASVRIVPEVDTLATGQSRVYRAVAFDARGDLIADAAGFEFITSNSAVAQISAGGVVSGVSAGDVLIYAKLNGKKDTAFVHVRVATTGAIRGRVISAGSGAVIAGGPVVSSLGPQATTDGNGEFLLDGLTPGSNLLVNVDAHVPVTYYNPPVALGQTVDLGDLPLAPSGAAAAGSITGHVLNALDDAPVVNATVRLYPGINAPSANPATGATTPAAVAETVTDGQGNFLLADIAPGTYTYAVGAPGFSLTRGVAVSIGGVARGVRVALPPTVIGTASALRIVLSWGDCAAGASNLVPCDLDSHITGPASAPDEGRFHVAYFNEVYVAGGDTVAALDNDAISGLGPETITLRPRSSGAFKFYVHNYSDGADSTSTRLSSSEARVRVYRGTNLVATFRPPTGRTGTLWAVFQYDGATITPVDELVRVQDFPVVPRDFLRAPSESDEIRTILARRWK